MKLYEKTAKKTKMYKELLERKKNGENFVIIDIDGPHQESMPRYKKLYNVPDDFIDQDSVLINYKNVMILINDDKHPYGHGYCLGYMLHKNE